MTRTLSPLFRPLSVRSLELPNRIVMSPMTRSHSPSGVPGADVAEYYRRRAAGGTGLIITEGTAIEHPTAMDNTRVPRMYGDDALEGWRRVIDAVHSEGGKIVPQLWHVGPLWGAMAGDVDPDLTPMRPSGLWGEPGVTSYSDEYVARATPPCRAMTGEDIADVIAAYTQAARNAREVGFDGIALHGGHGYLLDSFLWDSTNQRDDEWGGDLERRTRFPSTVVASIRKAIGDDAPIFFRFSQHKQQDFTARIAQTPDELKTILTALADAGVDVFDASIRRFDVAAFEGSDLSLAGWAKKLTGAMSMAVGSVGIGASLRESRLAGVAPTDDNIPELERRLSDDEFDLIAIGRLHLADPALATKLRDGAALPEFDRSVHESTLT
ncbi:2,4-dienoyl-CoA reductase-like NADH-dependent reductase (Old Yellow Enzyme family) [Rhodococcus sp. SMB37]|uniref:NADH:flavin oxidoreductase n=1 Tax=Rhodococcus sp. SMB37 TaxID=2512213 RepID=UPI0006D092D0|nr:NADH:flavin oxidoreductase [Rhodococcus sp. SMB37]TCN51322.1 2,4-dienoyl-CoA reductase-like NADH-dependent reductase (Old Yellow Enzyme family) [Rhodococcus sp. SMB37]